MEALRSGSSQSVSYWLLMLSDWDVVEGERRVQQARCTVCFQPGKGQHLGNGLLELLGDDGVAGRKDVA